MQENEFEKRVQKKMEEFRLRPSDVVWERVEEELRKKKKRRVVFFIFLLAGLCLLGYSGYFLFNNSKQNTVAQNDTLKNNNKPVKHSNGVIVPEIKKEITSEQPSVKEDQLPVEKVRTLADTDDKDISGERPWSKKQNAVKTRRDKLLVKKLDNNVNPVATNSDTKDKEQPFQQNEMPETKVTEKSEISQPGIVQKDVQQNKQPVIQQEYIPAKIDSAIAKAGEENKTETAVKDKTEAVVKKESKKSSKINWAIDLSAGMSNTQKNAFLFSGSNKSLNADYSSPLNNATGGFYRPVLSPSSVSPGPAFRLGVVGEMKISKRSSIVFGLQYAYLSNTMQVGSRRDTAVVLSNALSQSLRLSSVYSANQQKEFTNRYHFIQLPAGYQLQLNKGTRLPILWSIGASAGYLFSTNGLIYNSSAGGIYYRDKALFNKIHFNLNSGFSLRFGTNKKMQWSLGPELSLGMSKLSKDTYDKKQHLLYGGITSRLFFSKKK